jgi:hypothetical protein
MFYVDGTMFDDKHKYFGNIYMFTFMYFTIKLRKFNDFDSYCFCYYIYYYNY